MVDWVAGIRRQQKKETPRLANQKLYTQEKYTKICVFIKLIHNPQMAT
jgi:hypothetical protein